MKICSKCKKEKELSEFSRRNNKILKDGLRSWCKLCYSKYKKQYYKRRKEEINNKCKFCPKHILPESETCLQCYNKLMNFIEIYKNSIKEKQFKIIESNEKIINKFERKRYVRNYIDKISANSFYQINIEEMDKLFIKKGCKYELK